MDLHPGLVRIQLATITTAAAASTAAGPAPAPRLEIMPPSVANPRVGRTREPICEAGDEGMQCRGVDLGTKGPYQRRIPPANRRESMNV